MKDTIQPLQDEFDRAELHADTETLERLLADDFLSIDPRGFVLAKEEWIGCHVPFTYLELQTGEIDICLYDSTAIVRNVQRNTVLPTRTSPWNSPFASHRCGWSSKRVGGWPRSRAALLPKADASSSAKKTAERKNLYPLGPPFGGCPSIPSRHTIEGDTTALKDGEDVAARENPRKGGLVMTVSRRRGNPGALGGILFAVFFILGGELGGMLSSDALPLPGAPAAEVARYFAENQTAVLAVGLCQILSAASLFVFVAPVAALVRRVTGDRGALHGLTSGSGVLSAVLLLACALLGMVLALTVSGLSLGLVDTLRQANFLTGGTLHVASLGVFVGSASVAGLRPKSLPRWMCWLGIVQATLAILSLVSLIFFPAALLILLGRLLGFVWCIAVGILLMLRGRRGLVAGD